MIYSRAILIASAIFITGCGTPETELPTISEVEKELTEQWQVYVEGVKNKDIDLALSVWSVNLRLFSDPGGTEEISGREGYRSLMESAFPVLTVEDLTTERDEVLILDSDDAFETGRWSETYRFEETGVTATYHGAYAALWRLESDGKWRIQRFIRNRHDLAP